MKKYLLSLFMMLSAMSAMAQMGMGKPIDIDLWPNGLPNSNGIDKTQPYNDETRNFKPSIRVYLPFGNETNRKAVLVIPGGGYRVLSLGQEGYDWATHLMSRGIVTIVLRYRMPNGVTEVPLSDATEAMRLIREHAAEWKIDPNKVGILGSSAGGHIAAYSGRYIPHAGKAPV